MAQMLCGDEIKAAIIDLGTSISKFGTAGQDLPRHIFRSDVGESGDGTVMVGDARYILTSIFSRKTIEQLYHQIKVCERGY